MRGNDLGHQKNKNSVNLVVHLKKYIRLQLCSQSKKQLKWQRPFQEECHQEKWNKQNYSK